MLLKCSVTPSSKKGGLSSLIPVYGGELYELKKLTEKRKEMIEFFTEKRKLRFSLECSVS